MKVSELLDLVPVHKGDRFDYVRCSEIPQPWRDQFAESMKGSTYPVMEGEPNPYGVVFAWDWVEFVMRGRYGVKPQGLEPG